MSEHRIQCLDCKNRFDDLEFAPGVVMNGATCAKCKKYKDYKPKGITVPVFDFEKDPLDETGYYIECKYFESIN